MATTNYSWNLPTVGGSEDTWGTQLNANWTALDTLLGGTNATEFAILDGATVTTAELNYLSGVTGDVQTQLDAKLSETNPVISAGTLTEDVYTVSGTSVSLEPDNGSIQVHALTGNTTYTDGLSAGQAITLMIDDGSAYTITWPTMTWVNNNGAAPILASTGYTVVALWKVGATLYGALVGDGS